ncbi:MAG: toxin-antitoxin system YwqK family antitoxin [Ferruginibacter sp.]
MKNILIGVILIFLTESCDYNNEIRISKGDFDLVGNFINDTIPNGLIKFYDKYNKLAAIRNYKNGLPDGISINYFQNGFVNDSCNYLNGYQNGFNCIYDSLGNLTKRTYYIYGKQIGPVYTYNSSNLITEYSFNNFENDILYYYSYDSNTKKEYFPNDKFLLKATTEEITSNGEDGINVFLYLIQPPHLKLNYKICHFNKMDKVVDSFNLPTNNFYFEKFYKIPPDSLKIGILINKYDSTTKKEVVIIEQLKTSYP